MDSSTPKRWFYANWIQLFSILEKKSTSALYVAKFAQCNIAGKELRKFSSISYTFTQGEGNRYALTRGEIFFVSRNAKWCLILLFWSELILFGLNRTIKHLLVLLLCTGVTQVQKIANFEKISKVLETLNFVWNRLLHFLDMILCQLDSIIFNFGEKIYKFVQCNIAEK